jgi:hypothetical protein
MQRYPPPVDVPTSMSLCGELKHQTTCLGTYMLAPQRTAHGKPVWKHATEDKWIALGSTGIWMVQIDEDVGVNNLAVMTLENGGGGRGKGEGKGGDSEPFLVEPAVPEPAVVWIPGEYGDQHCRYGNNCMSKWCSYAHPSTWQHVQRPQPPSATSEKRTIYVAIDDPNTANLPHQSTAVWEEYDGKQWVKAPACKCFGDVPTSLGLCGELKHLTECLGTYLLAPQRTAHGKPVWKHAKEDKWIARASDGEWVVQPGANVGVDTACCMFLHDTTASLPHQSTAVWEENGHGNEWVKATTCKCFGDVPTSLSLYGELEHHTECLGTYLLAPQRTAHGKPVWKHAKEDKWIARASDGEWVVQPGANVGVDTACCMFLHDTTASLPHQSTAVWEENGHGNEWVKATTCKCFGDVPTSLSLYGELEHHTECLGTYLLAPQRTAHGKPVWKHTSEDKWIALGSTGKWMVQIDEDVGINNLAVMTLENGGGGRGKGKGKGGDSEPFLVEPAVPEPAVVWIPGEYGDQHCRNGNNCMSKWCSYAHPSTWQHVQRPQPPSATSEKRTIYVATANLPHQSTAVWEEYDGTAKQWVKAPACKCFGDVPTTMSLCGELKIQTACLGTYLLAPQRTAHGKPVWKHATEDKWIARASDGEWVVQPGANVGVDTACCMFLHDTTASLPHQSTAVWEENGHGNEWVKATPCKCFGDVPTSLSLYGELEHHTECLGTYLLAPQRTAHGKPVWKHEMEDRWIAWASAGKWMVQPGANVGVDGAAYMQLPDSMASLPHQSTAVWEEGDCKQYVKAPKCKVENTSAVKSAEKAAAKALQEGLKVRMDLKAHRALEEDGFALRPLLASDASVLRSLEALLETEHPEWLGEGNDVSENYGPYDSLKLACAWKVDHPSNQSTYTTGVEKVQLQLDLLKKKGKDVDKVPGLPVRTARAAAEGFTTKAGANEAILLHGTSPERLLELLSTGFNVNYSGTGAGTFFGGGVYLAEDVGKTDQYVGADSAWDPSSELHKRLYGRTVRHPGDVFYVLVVRAALGYPVRTKKTGKDATSMDNGARIFPICFKELSPVPGVTPPTTIKHHSLIAELGKAIVRYREFVLFHSEYVHIDYLIAYHRCNGGQKQSTTDKS